MARRYIHAPQAARDLVGIWRYIKKEAGQNVVDGVEAAIRDKIVMLSETPGAGHKREDLTTADVRFFGVYTYLIVFRPQTHPLEVVSILHGNRDVARILSDRL